MVNVVGYIRVSTMGQVKEGYSLGEQLDEIEKFCVANGYNLIETFRDEGKSGAKTNDDMEIERDGLLDLLDRIKKGDSLPGPGKISCWGKCHRSSRQ